MKFIFSLALQGPYIVWLLPACPASPPPLLSCSAWPQQPFQREPGRLRSPGRCTCRSCSPSLRGSLQVERQGLAAGGGPGRSLPEVGRRPRKWRPSPPSRWSRRQPRPCVPGPWAMENGEVYRATTEAHPGPGRGPRSGLAAYFTLSRLTGFRRLKLVELVSPRLGRERGGSERRPACCWEAAVSTSPVPSRSARGGAVPHGGRPAPLPPGPLLEARPPPPPARCSGPPSVFGGRRKCVGEPSQRLTRSLLLCSDLWLFSLRLPCIISQSVRVWTTNCFFIFYLVLRFSWCAPNGTVKFVGQSVPILRKA